MERVGLDIYQERQWCCLQHSALEILFLLSSGLMFWGDSAKIWRPLTKKLMLCLIKWLETETQDDKSNKKDFLRLRTRGLGKTVFLSKFKSNETFHISKVYQKWLHSRAFSRLRPPSFKQASNFWDNKSDIQQLKHLSFVMLCAKEEVLEHLTKINHTALRMTHCFISKFF